MNCMFLKLYALSSTIGFNALQVVTLNCNQNDNGVNCFKIVIV